MKRLLSYYHPKLPIFLVYMLQQVEYRPGKFLEWILRFPDLTKVMHRQQLVKTPKAQALLVLLGVCELFYISTAAWYLVVYPPFALITILVTPPMIILLTYLIVLFGWLYIEEPRRSSLLKRATKQFAEHPAIKIAIAGSYGKTTMKEILHTVLAEGRKVEATPGNKNVPVSHAKWIKQVDSDTEILLVEFGEGAPGDIKKLAKLTHPDYGVITGLAPNHLDEYKTLAKVAKDLLSLSSFVEADKLFINNDGDTFKGHNVNSHPLYNQQEVLGWKIEQIQTDLTGTRFLMKRARQKLKLHSALIGEHQVGPLAFAAALAFELGLSARQIEAGIAKTQPFPHRMQARHQYGAWIIDDTYNGSLEGFRAGLALLKKLPAKRKVYVTPGLVDQGAETEPVHLEIGELIAQAQPDSVVLMQNSVTQFIIKGLEAGEYEGDLHIVVDPLLYYTNLEHSVANGDLVLMQNDWTDNYA